MAKKLSEQATQLHLSLDKMQEAVDRLRLFVKYQTFDLEATRRENKYLKQLLVENGIAND